MHKNGANVDSDALVFLPNVYLFKLQFAAEFAHKETLFRFYCLLTNILGRNEAAFSGAVIITTKEVSLCAWIHSTEAWISGSIKTCCPRLKRTPKGN